MFSSTTGMTGMVLNSVVGGLGPMWEVTRFGPIILAAQLAHHQPRSGMCLMMGRLIILLVWPCAQEVQQLLKVRWQAHSSTRRHLPIHREAGTLERKRPTIAEKANAVKVSRVPAHQRERSHQSHRRPLLGMSRMPILLMPTIGGGKSVRGRNRRSTTSGTTSGTTMGMASHGVMSP